MARASQRVGRRVASKEGQLKKQGADKPGGRAAPEPRQNELGQDGLNLKLRKPDNAMVAANTATMATRVDIKLVTRFL